MIKVELEKQRKVVWGLVFSFPIILNVLLYIDLTFRYRGYLLLNKDKLLLSNWQLIFKEQTVFYFSELFYVVLALIIYEIFALEFKDDAWLNIISSPLRNKFIINSKLAITVLYTFIFWVSDYISLFVVGRVIDNSLKIDFSLFFKSFIIQFFSSVVLIFFYFLVLIFSRKISSLIPLGISMMILTISVYYRNYNFKVYLPFTYLSHAFRMTDSQFVVILLSCLLLFTIFYELLRIFNKMCIEISF